MIHGSCVLVRLVHAIITETIFLELAGSLELRGKDVETPPAPKKNIYSVKHIIVLFLVSFFFFHNTQHNTNT